MKLGVVVDGHWSFIQELLADWQSRYQTQIFKFADVRSPAWEGRINRWRLRRSLQDFLAGNEVVFFEWAGPLLVAASRLPSRARIVVRLHSFELFEYAPHIRWDAVAHVLLVSRAMQRHFCQRFPAAAEKTSVVYNGVALDTFKPAERSFAGVIGMLGNLIPIKRVYEVMLAVYELKRQGVAPTLRIAGPTEKGAEGERYYLAMQRLVRELGLEEQVFFVGQVSDPASFLRSVDIFVSNSFWEGQQVALLEALSTGCYCLAHRWDGAEEVLPPDCLFVTDSELRGKIQSYFEASDSVRAETRSRLRAIACEKFDLARMQAQLRAALEGAR